MKMRERNPQKNEEVVEDHNTIVKETEELMIPPPGNNNNEFPTLRKTHILKPPLNLKNQQFQNPHFFSPSPNLNLKEFTKRVFFKGRPKPQNSWKEWVYKMQKTHKKTWEKAGIFDAIRVSTYNIKRDNDLVIEFASYWCIETNTFVFPWGEATITLEDVMILGGFSVLGVSVVTPDHSKKVEFLEQKMVHCFAEIRRSNKNQVSHYSWMEYFKGKGGEIEHVGILVLWLSRYVSSTNFYNIISQNLFNLAISLAMGTKIALAPAVLAAIYRDLRLLKEDIVAFSCRGGGDEHDHGPNLTVWALFQFVQLWGWERFSRLSPVPALIVRGEPRVARWHDKNKVKFECLKEEIECAADRFYWKPYALKVRNWDFPKFHCDSDQGKWVVLDSEMDEQLRSFVRCLMPCELVGVDCVEQYLPHRVGLQFGFDQDIPNFVPRSNDDFELGWGSYCKPLDGLELYLPPRLFEGDVTVRYSKWWSTISNSHGRDLIAYKRSRLEKQIKAKEQDKKRRKTGLSSFLSGTGSEGDDSKEFPSCSSPSCEETSRTDSPGSSNENSTSCERDNIIPSQNSGNSKDMLNTNTVYFTPVEGEQGQAANMKLTNISTHYGDGLGDTSDAAGIKLESTQHMNTSIEAANTKLTNISIDNEDGLGYTSDAEGLKLGNTQQMNTSIEAANTKLINISTDNEDGLGDTSDAAGFKLEDTQQMNTSIEAANTKLTNISTDNEDGLGDTSDAAGFKLEKTQQMNTSIEAENTKLTNILTDNEDGLSDSSDPEGFKLEDTHQMNTSIEVANTKVTNISTDNEDVPDDTSDAAGFKLENTQQMNTLIDDLMIQLTNISTNNEDGLGDTSNAVGFKFENTQQMNTLIDDLMVQLTNISNDNEDGLGDTSNAAGFKLENTQQMNTSIDDLMILSDTEDDVCGPFEAKGLELEDRISELERVISVISKFRSRSR